ncbi:MAG: methyltransferase domain-containing protein [Candidatus Aminicenantaceae bacterium]
MNPSEKIREFYEKKAGEDAQGSPSFIQRVLNEFLAGLPLRHNDKVLDLGSGIGNNLNVLTRHFYEIVALDISEKALKKSARLHKNSRTKFVKGDILNLPFTSQSYDVVVCTGTLEHITDLRKGIREIARVLKRKGYGVFTVPNYTNLAGYYKWFRDRASGRRDWCPWHTHEGGFERFMTPGLLKRSLKDSFTVRETRGVDYSLSWLFFTPVRRFVGFKTIGKIPFIKRLGMHYCVLAQTK